MNFFEFKEEMIAKLESYLRDRIELSNLIRCQKGFLPITMQQYYDYYLINNGHNNDYGKRIKMNEEELDTMFEYIKGYLREKDISDYPSCETDSHFFMEIFKLVFQDMSENDSQYEEIFKYLCCTTAMKDELINRKFIGKIANINHSYFYVEDNSHKRFISYSNDICENSVSDFTPVIFYKDFSKFSSVKDKVSFWGIERENGYWSLFEDRMYDKSAFDNLEEPLAKKNFDMLMQLMDCNFLRQDDEVIGANALKNLVNGFYKYTSMTGEEIKEYNIQTFLASNWWIEAYEKWHNIMLTTEQRQALFLELQKYIKCQMIIQENLDFTLYSTNISGSIERANLSLGYIRAKMAFSNGGINVQYYSHNNGDQNKKSKIIYPKIKIK